MRGSKLQTGPVECSMCVCNWHDSTLLVHYPGFTFYITVSKRTSDCPLVAGRTLNTVLLRLPQCTISTWAAECRASTTARMRLALVSRRCTCPMMAREELSTSRSRHRPTPPTNTPTSTTQTTRHLPMRPPSTQTACSTSISVGRTAGENRCSSLVGNEINEEHWHSQHSS